MRATRFVVFLRFIGAAGVGSCLGAAAAGLLAVLTGSVFVAGSTWVTALPILAVVGMLIAAGVARLTRHWLLPQSASRRTLRGAAAGAVLVPLVAAVGWLGDLVPAGLLLMLVGTATAASLWMRWFHATSGGRSPGRVSPSVRGR